MVHKTKEIRKRQISSEKYILFLLIVSYFAGIYIGCRFTYLSNNIIFINYIAKNSVLNDILCIIAALLLKYSGILNGVLYMLPFFSGIQNSVFYCKFILSDTNISYSFVMGIIKDTAVLMMLLLYILIIINQIINKKYNIKKDLKYVSAYLSGIVVIYFLEYILVNIIF